MVLDEESLGIGKVLCACNSFLAWPAWVEVLTFLDKLGTMPGRFTLELYLRQRDDVSKIGSNLGGGQVFPCSGREGDGVTGENVGWVNIGIQDVTLKSVGMTGYLENFGNDGSGVKDAVVSTTGEYKKIKGFLNKFRIVSCRQRGFGGLAGPLSTGLCLGVTVDWFRRAVVGKKTWEYRKVKGGSASDVSVEREVGREVKWRKKRARIKELHADGRQPNLGANFVTNSGEGLSYSRFICGNGAKVEFADKVLFGEPNASSRKQRREARKDIMGNLSSIMDTTSKGMFSLSEKNVPADHEDDSFFRINLTLDRFFMRSLGHTFGVRIPRSEEGEGRHVYVFDASYGEYKIPRGEFSKWMECHIRMHYPKCKSFEWEENQLLTKDNYAKIFPQDTNFAANASPGLKDQCSVLEFSLDSNV